MGEQAVSYSEQAVLDIEQAVSDIEQAVLYSNDCVPPVESWSEYYAATVTAESLHTETRTFPPVSHQSLPVHRLPPVIAIQLPPWLPPESTLSRTANNQQEYPALAKHN